MLHPKCYRALLVALVIGCLPACTENSLDSSEADVFLQVLEADRPNVVSEEIQETIGECSEDDTIQCDSNQTCSEQLAGFCVFDIVTQCAPKNWKFTVEVVPLSEGAAQSQLNNVLLDSIFISYTPDTVEDLVVDLGQTIKVGQQSTVTFPPILVQEIEEDETTVLLSMTWSAGTVNGKGPVTVVGGDGGPLIIEKCLPEE